MEIVISRSPFASSRNARWPLVGCVFLVAPVAVLIGPGGDLVSGGETPAKPNEGPKFEGKWDGTYLEKGKPAKGEYEFLNDKDGRLEVMVSWKDKGGNFQKMKLQGKRLGLAAMYLEGKHEDTANRKTYRYRYMGRMEKGQLVLYWLYIEPKTGQSGSGISTLTRPKESTDR